ncbi:tax1-binding protein 1 homolog [Gigantopelta aegis]|uniref:tax1-binding protein 1 homolog n=1 Tax=Gigantopelta aegis TaxID=1735272 RepID=UPI001B8893D4|nr:tax1-binding protein 1 homolog [Gigantopelta aegis]
MADNQNIEIIPSLSEAKFHRSEFASVVFHNVAEVYPADAHVDCMYTITADITATSRDWVGLYKVGWISPKDYIYYEWAPMPKDYKPQTEAEGEILFQAHTLPKEDGEFYQFCYVSSSGQVRGASTPFQFKEPCADDFVEFDEEEMDMLVIRSKTVVLMENLNKVEDENKKLNTLKEKMEEEIKSLVDKVRMLNKSLDKEKKQRKKLNDALHASEAKLEEMLSESNDMTLVHDELTAKINALTESKSEADKSVEKTQEELLILQVKVKVLQSEKDELDGKNRTITEEMELYKSHLSKSENSASEYVHEIDILKARLDEHSATVTELRGRLEQNEQLVTKYTEEICCLKSQLLQESQKVEHQVNVTQSEKENVRSLVEKLQNVEDQLEAAEGRKEMICSELVSYKDAQDKMSSDLASSRSDCLSMKEQMVKMEQDFLTEIDVLQKEHKSVERDLGNVLKEKEELQAKVCQLQDDLEKMQDNLDSTSAPIYALKKANDVLKERLDSAKRIINEKNAEIVKLQKYHTRSHHELTREVEDLKERIQMCTEEYKRLYVENKKCRKRFDKLLQRKPKGLPEGREPAIHKEKLLQSPASESESRIRDRRSSSSSCSEAALTCAELETQVCELRGELERQMTKKEKYKKMCVEEKESQSALRQHYYEQLQARDDQIKQLTLGGKSTDHADIEHKLRMMENCLNQKEKEIEELTQKLRTSKLRQLWSVWDETMPEEGSNPVPTKRTSLKKLEVSDSSCEPAVAPASNAVPSEEPALIYGNPYVEESMKLTQEGAAAASAAVSLKETCSIAYPPQPVQYAETGEITTDSDGMMSPSSQTFVASVYLPMPLQPEVLPTARVAALKATLPWMADCSERQTIMFEVGNRFPSAPPESFAERIVTENGDVIKKCPICETFFESESMDFGLHYMEHFGRICPMCRYQADDTVSKEDFEYHVNCCIEKNN